MAQETERAERLEREVLFEKLNSIIAQHHGLAKTSVLKEAGISYKTILVLVERGELIRVKSGYYSLPDREFSEEEMIVSQYPDAVLTMDTALFYQGYIADRPEAWSIAVSKNISKSRFKLKIPAVKPYFTEDKVLEMGVETIMLAGEPMRIYSVDRLICDVMRYRDRLEPEIFRQAVRAYLEDDRKNVELLMEYASSRRVLRKIENILGTWMTIPEVRRQTRSRARQAEVTEVHSSARQAEVTETRSRARQAEVTEAHSSARQAEVTEARSRARQAEADAAPAAERTAEVPSTKTGSSVKRSYISLQKSKTGSMESDSSSRVQQALDVLKESREYGKTIMPSENDSKLENTAGMEAGYRKTAESVSADPGYYGSEDVIGAEAGYRKTAESVSADTEYYGSEDVAGQEVGYREEDIAESPDTQQIVVKAWEAKDLNAPEVQNATEPPQRIQISQKHSYGQTTMSSTPQRQAAGQASSTPQRQIAGQSASTPQRQTAGQASPSRTYGRMISHSDADADREAARGMLRSALNEAGADLGIADTHVPERVAAVVFQILLRMELLEDMSLLQELYDILCSYTVDGLAVSRHLRDICEEDDFLPNEARVNKLNGWILDRFMEQKWIKYIKRQEEMSLQWSEVSQKLAAFIVPIGQALANGNYYTGEWMPKIARYIG